MSDFIVIMMIDLDAYKRLLLDLRSTFSARVHREAANGLEQNLGCPGVSGDAAVTDKSEIEDFTEAELQTVTLQEIDAALRRIEDGTYGRCLVDGGPIESKRLQAVPRAAYCTKHQTLREAPSRPYPTL